MSPQTCRCSWRTFVFACGSSGRNDGSWTSGASVARAVSIVKAGGSSSYATFTSAAASSAASLVSAATAATGSPWYLASPVAMTGRSRRCRPKRGIGDVRVSALRSEAWHRGRQVPGRHHEADTGDGAGGRVVDGADTGAGHRKRDKLDVQDVVEPDVGPAGPAV